MVVKQRVNARSAESDAVKAPTVPPSPGLVQVVLPLCVYRDLLPFIPGNLILINAPVLLSATSTAK